MSVPNVTEVRALGQGDRDDDLVITAQALSHRTRVLVLRRLAPAGSTVSPVVLARELDLDVGRVGHHFRCLARAGLIELSETIARRGATEHVYRLTRRARNRLNAWRFLE